MSWLTRTVIVCNVWMTFAVLPHSLFQGGGVSYMCLRCAFCCVSPGEFNITQPSAVLPKSRCMLVKMCPRWPEWEWFLLRIWCHMTLSYRGCKARARPELGEQLSSCSPGRRQDFARIGSHLCWRIWRVFRWISVSVSASFLLKYHILSDK